MGKRLVKGNDRIFFGVCSGIADYLDMDPTVIRLLTVVLGIVALPTIIVYLFGAFIMPEN
jgi:phage shock protein C